MIKRTLYFGNPAYLGLTDKQLVVRLPQVEKSSEFNESFKKDAQARIPVEDIGIVILDNKQITITQGLLSALLENNCAVIQCNSAHMPVGILMPLEGNTIQAERFKYQIDTSEPLKKQLWQQTVQSKIRNQAAVLIACRKDSGPLTSLIRKVNSGDPYNCEGTAAAYYWKNLFPGQLYFTRSRDGLPPNNLLNYGYAILRAVTARSLVSSGLLPTLGIHHRNRYNAFALADDIMEPYRPYVDKIVLEIVESVENYEELSIDLKKKFFVLPVTEVCLDGETSPLMAAMFRTTSSLVKCFDGTSRKLLYPEI